VLEVMETAADMKWKIYAIIIIIIITITDQRRLQLTSKRSNRKHDGREIL